MTETTKQRKPATKAVRVDIRLLTAIERLKTALAHGDEGVHDAVEQFLISRRNEIPISSKK